MYGLSTSLQNRPRRLEPRCYCGGTRRLWIKMADQPHRVRLYYCPPSGAQELSSIDQACGANLAASSYNTIADPQHFSRAIAAPVSPSQTMLLVQTAGFSEDSMKLTGQHQRLELHCQCSGIQCLPIKLTGPHRLDCYCQHHIAQWMSIKLGRSHRLELYYQFNSAQQLSVPEHRSGLQVSGHLPSQ
jgi:hypothetical protein